jgi:hypothetical protein
MKKRYLAIGLAALATVISTQGPAVSAARAAASEPSRQELVDEVKQLREIVDKLSSRLTDAEKRLAESSTVKVEEKITKVEDDLDDLDSRVGATERHTVMDKVTLSVDLRSEVTSMIYQDARVLPEWNQSMMSLWAFDQLAVPFATNTAYVDINPTDTLVGKATANGFDLNGDGATDYTFNPTFVNAYGSNLMPYMTDMFMGGMFSGFYLPTGAAAFGLPAGAFVSQADAAGMMVGNGMDPTNKNDVNAFFGQFTAVAPDAQVALASSGAGGGIPLFSKQFTGNELKMYQGMFNSIAPQEQDIKNDAIWTSRIRLDLRSDPTPNLTFGGRLSANKVWGDSTGIKWYSGDMSSVAMDGNINQKGSDSAIRMERGFVTYRDDSAAAPWHFSLGRRPALDGAPWEVSQNSVVGGSPMAHAINWQFDGASLGFDLSKQAGIDGFNFKICYGSGFESGVGSGNSYAMAYDNDVSDTSFLGYIMRLYEKGDTRVINMYAHAFDITDGFTGLVAMPFAIAGVDADGNGAYDTYFLDANKGGYVSRMEAFTNIGSMDLLTLLYQTKISDVDFFIDLAGNYASPSGRSLNPMMQFMGTDGLLSGDGDYSSKTGYSVWAGMKVPVTKTGGALGFEWNWGSRYWFGFNGGEDTLNASKLATRGHVLEAYYHQPIIGKKLLVTIGGQYYLYEYNLSGNPMGNPKKIDDLTALDTIMPSPDTMWSAYANLNYRW